MMVVEKCETCEAEVGRCDNNVLLDLPAVEWDPREACWTIMSIGGHHLASVGGAGTNGKGHTLHEHQPPEVD